MINHETVIAPLPYTTRIDRHGVVRMSSHMALVADATLHLAQRLPDAEIFLAGENTFGSEFPSTSSVVRDQLVKKGIDPLRITTVDGVNDTESQLKAMKEHGITDPLFVALDFHIDRVEDLSRQTGVSYNPTVLQAESIILDAHVGATPERLEKVVTTKTRMFRKSKVYLFEGLAKRAVRLGKPGKLGLAALRFISGKSGPTVTDYHDVDSARNHMKRAKKEGRIKEELILEF